MEHGSGLLGTVRRLNGRRADLSRGSPADGEDGFTLVELMVVVLIIAVLIAMALVSFLGARRAAADRAAHTLARQTLSTAKAIFQENEDYRDATVGALQASEPGLDFVAANQVSNGPLQASVDSPDKDTFIVAVLSNTGTCFYLKDEAVPLSGGTTYGEKTSGSCQADSPPGSFASSW